MKRIITIVSASALLMGLAGMATATTPSTYDWQGNGYPNVRCDAGSTTAQWNWTGDNPVSLTINGHEQTGSWTQMGEGSWHWTITIGAANFPPTTASITYTGQAGTLTLSGCDEGGAQPSALPAPTASTMPSALPAPTASTMPSALPAPTASTMPSALPAPTASTMPSASPAPTASTMPSASPAPTASPAGGVGGVTGTPTPTGAVAGVGGTADATPPPTDALGSVQLGSSNDGWRNVLIGLATLLIVALAFTAQRRSSRRR